jgi:transposase
MKAMARHRSHSIEFKRQVAQEFVAGETLYALAKRYDISRTLIRVWIKKLEAGALDEDAQAADLLQEYEAKIAALERMVGRQALEITLPPGCARLVTKPLPIGSPTSTKITGMVPVLSLRSPWLKRFPQVSTEVRRSGNPCAAKMTVSGNRSRISTRRESLRRKPRAH